MNVQKITPFLWLSNGAKETAEYYISVFKNSKILSTNPMVTNVEIEGLQVILLNGGPIFQLNEAFSLSISCETQEEIDYYWNKLSEGGSEGRCGWLKDKFGVSWQVVPTILSTLLSNPGKAEAVTNAFLKMTKFDIEKLKQA